MTNTAAYPRRRGSVLAGFAAVVAWMALASAQQGTQPSIANGEWPSYSADLASTHYSPLA